MTLRTCGTETSSWYAPTNVGAASSHFRYNERTSGRVAVSVVANTAGELRADIANARDQLMLSFHGVLGRPREEESGDRGSTLLGWIRGQFSVPGTSLIDHDTVTGSSQTPLLTLTSFSDINTFPDAGFGGAVGLAGKRLQPPKSPSASIFTWGHRSKRQDENKPETQVELDKNELPTRISVLKEDSIYEDASTVETDGVEDDDLIYLRFQALVNTTAEVDPKTLSYWIPDEDCEQCWLCEKQFSAFRRKHHCRLCGRIFCYACSSMVNLGFVQPIRMCHRCYEVIKQYDWQDQLSVISTDTENSDLEASVHAHDSSLFLLTNDSSSGLANKECDIHGICIFILSQRRFRITIHNSIY